MFHEMLAFFYCVTTHLCTQIKKGKNANFQQVLVNKRADIIKALLTMWAEEVRLVVDDVIQAYKSIMRKLGEKPNTIEHVFEIREWIESVAFALKTQEDIMRKVFTVSCRTLNTLEPA